MRVLVACEESQAVCMAFRARGHEAYSCDIQHCSGPMPEYHLQMDAIYAIILVNPDLLIAHPPCTYFSAAGMHYLKTRPERIKQLENAFEFLNKIWNCGVKKIAIENPIGWLNTNWKKPTQIIQPFYFGDNERKATCLWLKGLSRLNGDLKIAIDLKQYTPKPNGFTKPGKDGYSRGIYFCGRINSKNRNKNAAKLKSKTFPGIARAMAEQWG